jgi:AraC family transcriptional activator of pobA
MSQILNINSIAEFHRQAGLELLHPLVSVIDRSDFKSSGAGLTAISFGFYFVSLKEDAHCHMRYGRSSYDYQAGTLVFAAPSQAITFEPEHKDSGQSGLALLFHPDLINGTALAHQLSEYSFFGYDVHEALHLAAEEKQLVRESFQRILYEASRPADQHSRKLISANIELFLNYCQRFYDRQFNTRDLTNIGLTERFNRLLTEYIQSGKGQSYGIPTVAYLAGELCLSPNYFGDLIKKETGKTPLEHIQFKLLQAAKEKIFDPGKSIKDVAYELGFTYPQHFTRFFKQHSGLSPNEYRNIN